MSRVVSINQLSAALQDELKLYHDSVMKGVKKETKKSMSKLVKETKATAPVGVRTKHYKDFITSKLIDETAHSVAYLWYVRSPEYRLSHLLEDGHATVNGGRTRAFKFIGKATDMITDDYLKAVEEVIKNG